MLRSATDAFHVPLVAALFAGVLVLLQDVHVKNAATFGRSTAAVLTAATVPGTTATGGTVALRLAPTLPRPAKPGYTDAFTFDIPALFLNLSDHAPWAANKFTTAAALSTTVASVTAAPTVATARGHHL